LKTSQIIETSVTQDQIVKTYSSHPELLQPGAANNQARTNIKKQYTPLTEGEIINNNIQNDQPRLDQTEQQDQQQTAQPQHELHHGMKPYKQETTTSTTASPQYKIEQK
jgi:hypothetical protein